MLVGEKLRWIIVGAVLLQFSSYFFNVWFPSAINALGGPGVTGGAGLDPSGGQNTNMVCFGNDCFCRAGYMGTTCSLTVAEMSSRVRYQELLLLDYEKKLEALRSQSPPKPNSFDSGMGNRRASVPSQSDLKHFSTELDRMRAYFTEEIRSLAAANRRDKNELFETIQELQDKISQLRESFLFDSNTFPSTQHPPSTQSSQEQDPRQPPAGINFA